MARKTAVYKENIQDFYSFLGISAEVGELLNRIKKVHRDRNGEFDDDDFDYIRKELGDILWYLSDICTIFDFELSDIAEANLHKLAKRSQLKLKGDPSKDPNYYNYFL